MWTHPAINPPSHLSQVICRPTRDLVPPKDDLLRHLATHAHPDAGQHLLPVDAELILTTNLIRNNRTCQSNQYTHMRTQDVVKMGG
jgi:hypothetical protein